MQPLLLSSACCPPAAWFSLVVSHDEVFIDQHEHFVKQTFRNRFSILGPNGKADLVIPVEKGRTPGQPIREVRIAYHTEWQRNHWRSLLAAYNNSPWFRDVEEEIRPFYFRKWEFLFDFNLDWLQTILGLLRINKEIRLTAGFEAIPGRFDNFREAITPKVSCDQWIPGYVQQEYTQVFHDKYPFIPGLSILDLLFNEGPMAGAKLGSYPQS